jgi:hypothetical protein
MAFGRVPFSCLSPSVVDREWVLVVIWSVLSALGMAIFVGGLRGFLMWIDNN